MEFVCCLFFAQSEVKFLGCSVHMLNAFTYPPFYFCNRPLLWSEFLATGPEVPGSIPGTTRFSEK
jgi:hypothetical protein